MDTNTQIERLIELAIVQRTELKQLVEQLPQLREHLSAEIERNLEEIEPQLRTELEEFVTQRANDEHAKLGATLSAKIDLLVAGVVEKTQARYSALVEEREKTVALAQQAEAKIAEHAASLPSAVKEIVTAELSRFPRAGEIDQLRKEFAEPRGLNPRGKWQPGEVYQRLDLVAYNGDSFVSSIDGNREKPSRSGGTWTLNAARGQGGGGGGITTLNDLYNVPLAGQVLIGTGSDYVNANLTGGDGITVTNAPGAITISANGGVNYQGTWNASTNTPTLASSVGTKGYYYVVSVAGTTNLNGVSDWEVGDWAVFNGSIWQKIDNTDKVSSVFGRTGAVVGVATDYSAVGLTGTAIGASNPSTGGFTTLTTTGNATVGGTLTVNGGTATFTDGVNYTGRIQSGGSGVMAITTTSGTNAVTLGTAGSGEVLRVASTGLTTLAGNLTVGGTGTSSVAGNLRPLLFSTTAGVTQTASSATTGVNVGFDGNAEHGWIQSTRNSSAETRNLQINPLGGNVLVGTATDSGNKLSVAGTIRSTTQTAPTSGAGVELFYDTGGATGYLISYDRTGAAYKQLNLGSSLYTFGISGTEQMRLNAAGNLLLKSDGVDSSNGRLQLATHTTSAGGIGFGTDTSLFRANAGRLAVGGTNAGILYFYEGGGEKGYVGTAGSVLYLGTSTAQAIQLQPNGTTALTLDSSQNATFAGRIISSTNRAGLNVAQFQNTSATGDGLYLNLASQGTSRYAFYVDSAAGTVYNFDQSGNATFAGTVATQGGTASTPASTSATGTAGTIRWDADYIYVCTAANTWKRAAIATW